MNHTAIEDPNSPSMYFNSKKNGNNLENWVIEKNGNSTTINQQTESPILDRRLMALKYSETFNISSRAEASVVLKLTQQLSVSLEQYFLNCKELEILPSSDCGNRKLGLESSLEKPPLDTEPNSPGCTKINAHSLDSLHEKLDVTSGKKDASEVISSIQDVFLQQSSGSGSQSRKLQKFEDSEIPFMSAQYIAHRYQDPPQPIPLDGFASQSYSATGPYYSNVTDVKANTEPMPLEVSSDFEVKAHSDLGMENNESESSSLQSSSTQAMPSSSQTQRKTSKTLNPDILQLLKGKDANTVTNILKTLSPFYPALQDVNLEILAEVLVNTGALD